VVLIPGGNTDELWKRGVWSGGPPKVSMLGRLRPAKNNGMLGRTKDILRQKKGGMKHQ